MTTVFHMKPWQNSLHLCLLLSRHVLVLDLFVLGATLRPSLVWGIFQRYWAWLPISQEALRDGLWLGSADRNSDRRLEGKGKRKTSVSVFHISTSLFLKIIVISYNIHKDKYEKSSGSTWHIVNTHQISFSHYLSTF